jgi:hypothetical protein
MPLAGFESTIPVFKRAKTFHALDRAATVTRRWSNCTRNCLGGKGRPARGADIIAICEPIV